MLNRQFRRDQQAAAEMRPSLGCDEFRAELAGLGVSAELSDFLYEALAEHCGEGIRPNPHDSLSGFYAIDADHLGDLIEEAFDKFALPMPTPRRPEVVPELDTPAELGSYIEQRRRELETTAPGP